MKDIVERLRKAHQETEIERLSAALERLKHMQVQANLHGHIKRLEDEIERLRIERDFCAAENAKLQKYKEAHARIVEIEATQERRIDEAEAENAKLREALEKIKECRIVDSNGNEVAEDSAYYMRSYARAALQKDEGE